jgi:hypothetical protein
MAGLQNGAERSIQAEAGGGRGRGKGSRSCPATMRLGRYSAEPGNTASILVFSVAALNGLTM